MTRKLGKLEVAAQLSVIPLYSGDATVGGYAGTGLRLSLNRFWGGDSRGAFVEAAYTNTPGERFNANRDSMLPRSRSAGVPRRRAWSLQRGRLARAASGTWYPSLSRAFLRIFALARKAATFVTPR